MLAGTADVAALAAGAATVVAWPSEPVTLTDTRTFHLVAELRRPAREALLPPGLSPTEPAALSIQAWKVAGSPWGPFTLVVTRLSCRSGVRARGMATAAVCSSATAAAALAAGWGYPCRVGAARLDVRYDGCTVTVTEGDQVRLAIEAVHPRPLGPDDVQYTATMTLAHTPQGLRLVQVEAEPCNERVERLEARIERFDAPAWGDARLDPYHVVAATLGTGTITIAPVRYVCRPDVDAFAGTERVA